MKRLSRSFAGRVSASLILSVHASSALAAPVKSKPIVAPEAVAGELIVRLRSNSLHAQSPEVARARIQQILSRSFGLKSVAQVESLEMDQQIQKVRLQPGLSANAAISTLVQSGEVKYAEPNFIYRTQVEGAAIPMSTNDPSFSQQWDMKNDGQADSQGQAGKQGSDVNVAPVWNRGITGDRRVVVAVIDTGVDYNHSDLRDNIYTNPGEAGALATNGIDDDGNGVVDDIHGASFATTQGTNASLDDHNHGTHCAGSIGATGNNGVGITGVNWAVSILPVKFLTASGGGSLDGAINSIKYATKMGVDIMSNSWGGGGYSQALMEAIQEANSAGILFVAAAGNNGSDNDAAPTYPANYDVPNVLSVAASDNRDVLAGFSNFGRSTVHVAAPGKNILSTVRNNGYASYSGTSMACPHVSGAAALLKAHEPQLTALEIKERLIQTSTPVASMRSRVLARGRINVTNAVDQVIPPREGPADEAWETVSYSLESPHPYAANTNLTFNVSVPGVKYIRVVFDRVDTEAGYDFVSIESSRGEAADSVSGVKSGYVSEYVTGDSLVVRLKSDSSEQRFGFSVRQIQVVR